MKITFNKLFIARTFCAIMANILLVPDTLL